MTTPETLLGLIAKATEAVGSEAALARAMGMPQQNFSGWKAGTRTCTPEDRARLAAFAKEDPVQELIRATLEKTHGTLRGEQLRQVLGKWSHQTGAATVGALQSLVSVIFLAWAMLAPAPAHAEPIFHDVYYVNC
ncbi:MAG: hypothetical protein Q7T70_02410 [Polaromonas sp.]|nr:hypothetical protein [Polaromonas sp.]